MAENCVLRPTIEISFRGRLSELPIIRPLNGWLAVPATGANDPRTGRRRVTRKRRGPPDVRPFFSDFGGSSGANHNILAVGRCPLYLSAIFCVRRARRCVWWASSPFFVVER